MRAELTNPTEGYSEPGRYWTQANIREACPEVMSPLCWSLWCRTNQNCTRQAWADFGLIARRDVPIPDDQNHFILGCFFGRQAVNVDRVREVLALAPGGDPDGFERDVMGYVRPDAPEVPRTSKRYPAVAARMPLAIMRQRRAVPRMGELQLQWWQSEVFSDRGALTPRALLDDAERRYLASTRLHLYSRGNLLPAAQAPLTALGEAHGGSEFAAKLTGGFGGTTEADIANDLWAVSRQRMSLEEFVRRHGFHGPSEGNPIAKSWRETPDPVRALAEAYAKRPDAQSPRVRERAAAEAHAAAVADITRGLSGPRKRMLKVMLASLGAQIRFLSQGKDSFLMAIDGVRAAARRIGEDHVSRGVFEDPDDAFYLTLDELRAPLPDNVGELIAFRRARRAKYQSMELPLTWFGVPQPTKLTVPDEDDPEVRGLAGSAGTAEGLVRVVVDPADADELAPGEIMVCRFTDPSWAALFPLAEAVVIDIGGPASHGAVVARELSIPCVIGTENGTQRLRTGDRVRVDGGNGVVTVLERGALSAER
jgi:phosphohistidine swiveling domain-containing protein